MTVVGLMNCFLVGSEEDSWKGINVQYHKPGQKPMAGKAVGPGEAEEEGCGQ